MIGAQSNEIALVPNTTMGITLVAEGLDWRAGDNVVILADEFPSNAYPWLNLERRAVETRRLATDGGRLDLNKLAESCDARTRIVSISWVGYSTGYRQNLGPIAELVHQRGALLMVDAIQGLGAFPLDVRKEQIDFLAADGHKWMLGPEGAGVAYIAREHLDQLRPIGVGWNSVVHAHDFSRIELRFKPSAARFEGGSQNTAGLMALGASLKLLTSLGIENVATAILAVTDQACMRLRDLGARILSHRDSQPGGHDPRSGIVIFELDGHDPRAVRQHCLDHHVAVACRGGRLRISPHAYNNEEDLDRLIEALQTV